MVEDPTTVADYINDPEVGPLILQVRHEREGERGGEGGERGGRREGEGWQGRSKKNEVRSPGAGEGRGQRLTRVHVNRSLKVHSILQGLIPGFNS